MKILVAGLGLIGGSICKALHTYTEHRVYGCDAREEVLQKALEQSVIDGVVTDDCSGMDMVIVALYPEIIRSWVKSHAATMSEGTVVVDVSGVKTDLPEELGAVCAQYHVHYLSTHPMAGKERSGYEVSDEDLFQGANFIITPTPSTPKSVIAQVKNLAHQIGFRRFVLTTPEVHDRMIAYTSQVPHVLACAYVMSPRCDDHRGFSAGSYRDVSRVAKINAELWADLFLSNRQELTDEIGELQKNIEKIRAAVADGDREQLVSLLSVAREKKEKFG